MIRQLVPWEVGSKDAIAIIGYQGDVTAKSDGSMVIAGHSVPTVLGDGVRYLSMVWPDESWETRCDRLHVDEVHNLMDDEDLCGHEGVSDLLAAVEKWHIDSRHGGASRFCEDDVCRAAAEVSP